jgi:hypothetical protein
VYENDVLPVCRLRSSVCRAVALIVASIDWYAVGKVGGEVNLQPFCGNFPLAQLINSRQQKGSNAKRYFVQTNARHFYESAATLESPLLQHHHSQRLAAVSTPESECANVLIMRM